MADCVASWPFIASAGGELHFPDGIRGSRSCLPFGWSARRERFFGDARLRAIESESFQQTNTPASPTPVTDGKRVYVFFGDFGLLAYDLDGNEVWRLPLGPFNNVNGHGSSPILAGNKLVLICDQDIGSYLIAVDKQTGKALWKI